MRILEAEFDALDEAVQDDLLAHANFTLDHNSAGPVGQTKWLSSCEV
jgi:hypothetical protein